MTSVFEIFREAEKLKTRNVIGMMNVGGRAAGSQYLCSIFYKYFWLLKSIGTGDSKS